MVHSCAFFVEAEWTVFLQKYANAIFKEKYSKLLRTFKNLSKGGRKLNFVKNLGVSLPPACMPNA